MRIPTHRKRVDGRGVCTLAGRDFYTGTFGTPEAQQNYDRLIAEYLANGRYVVDRGPGKTVAEIAAAYIAAGQNTDRRDGRAIPHLLALYGNSLADSFGPLCYKAVRSSMMAKQWTRQDVNLCMLRIRKVFRFAVENQMLQASVFQSLECVAGLKKGQHKEGKKIGPVNEQDFKTAILFLPRTLRVVAQLQWFTGARAGEILSIRPMDIDRTGPVWIYKPLHHKTEHKGHVRAIPLGPQAQEVLTPFLNRPADQLCFRPCDIQAHHGPRYSVTQYGALIRHACKRAGIPAWTSHQLRHSAGTRIRRDFGPDAAQALLGHQHMSMTERYAGPAFELAVEAMRKAG